MRFALKIARRYLSTRKEKSIVHKISNICIITVVVSIAVPILVLSVFGGFHQNVGNKLLAMEGDIKVIPPYIDFNNYDEIKKLIMSNELISPYIDTVIPYYTAYGIIKKGQSKYPTQILAVPGDFYNNNEYYNEEFANRNRREEGLPELSEGEVILGRKLMADLLANTYNTVSIYIPISINAMSINTKETDFEIAGGITTGFNQYEGTLTLMRFEDISKSFDIGNYATGLMIYLKNSNSYKNVVGLLNEVPELERYKYTLTQEEGLFIDFQREKGLMRTALIILVFASFMTIYITLNVVVLDKQKEIGIMKAFGVNSSTVSKIFIVEGFLIGIIGAISGVMLGLFMSVHLADIVHLFETLTSAVTCTFFDPELPFRRWFHLIGDCQIKVVPDDTFFITNMPSSTQLSDVLIQTIGAITAAVLAAYFPSTRASKQKPIETLMRK